MTLPQLEPMTLALIPFGWTEPLIILFENQMMPSVGSQSLLWHSNRTRKSLSRAAHMGRTTLLTPIVSIYQAFHNLPSDMQSLELIVISLKRDLISHKRVCLSLERGGISLERNYSKLIILQAASR
jgi:hypothetical protein